MHRDDDSVRPEKILRDRGFRPEHLTPREREELAQRLRRELEFESAVLENGASARAVRRE